MKKFETAEMHIKSVSRLKRGKDFEIIKKYFQEKEWQLSDDFIKEN